MVRFVTGQTVSLRWHEMWIAVMEKNGGNANNRVEVLRVFQERNEIPRFSIESEAFVELDTMGGRLERYLLWPPKISFASPGPLCPKPRSAVTSMVRQYWEPGQMVLLLVLKDTPPNQL